MFEYLLTSGFDFWDVLTAVKSGIAVHLSQIFNFLQYIQHFKTILHSYLFAFCLVVITVHFLQKHGSLLFLS